MKKAVCFIWILGYVLVAGNAELLAQKVTQSDALIAAGNFIHSRIPQLNIGFIEPLTTEMDTLAWIVHCQPVGFIIISATPYMPPVIAWSKEGNFGEGQAWEHFLPVFMNDIATRKRLACPDNTESAINSTNWTYWMNPAAMTRGFEQWPPEGWSPTGGWLFTNWTQSAPYNDFCPIDGQTHIRSIAGCPATAMAQIVNYHHDLHGTQFSNSDDYYHSFGTGNQYWIDNDWASYNFPSWDQLNIYLEALEVHFQNGTSLKNDDMAALTFACGAAAKQVYSSSVSGTYGINQAYDAFIRFGYTDAQLIYPIDPNLNSHLAENIKLGLPAHLGLVNPDETAGHNVVVDGYNTDEFYHFNFGWGGSANGWYTMPPTSIPYDLTVVEGIVLDINLSHPPVGLPHETIAEDHQYMLYLNETDVLRIKLPENSRWLDVSVFDISGRRLLRVPATSENSKKPFDIRLNFLNQGLYIARLETCSGKTFSLKFIR